MDPIASLAYFKPELILIAAVFVILTLDLAGLSKPWLGYLSIAALIGSVASLSGNLFDTHWLFFNLMIYDGFSVLIQILVLFMVGLPILATIGSTLIHERQKGEFYVMMLALALLLIIMGSTTHLLMIFLATEAVSLSSYLLVGSQKFNKKASEASLKYLLYGAVATAVLVFGMSLLYGLSGTLALTEMPIRLAKLGPQAQGAVLTAMVLMLVGFGFKISMAPFHMWAPDVYEGAPTPVAGFLTVAPKALGFLVLFRVLTIAFPVQYHEWSALLVILSMLTMTIGNVFAVSQNNVKRILAYSSVAQAGYILMGLAASSEVGVYAVFIYLITYLFTNLGAFLVVGIVEQSEGSNLLEAYQGLSKRNPFLAMTLTIFLLSLAGIPPLAGFIAKWFVFASAIHIGFISLAVVAAVNSAIAGFYYFKIVKAMYLSPGDKESPIRKNHLAFTAVLIALAGTILIGILPSPVIVFVQHAFMSFRTL
ncbi:MAG: NADH-quinone oxidoreductase subunit N [Candidatus Omnitrophica bacterium CG11_big_fil_rev_8_21_14_0_20_45_26]|uniref:NADH-quinone oxidoreductase subunit N n=1 Tax=Candidatus Abzuiibacterium crystallinum TaxID=1974748 RepID=A0A2H0LMB7_9BACT|nr:MAG: NADH-quinone oxidoreductase subunit N [Candidatus Omnitrophica bacterium CG11_big_fil_rev_8_21_14_0_20_45_26]PIW63681.1 MAG: NADH-quinone oxidoreductase subunit N [Candidatus Omnitrophica bacterium CG12_big_fil_rev_8_21_14_0_65_45_16]